MPTDNVEPVLKERFERVRIVKAAADVPTDKTASVSASEPSVEATASLHSDFFDFDTSKFDLMQVKVTIYTLSGIIKAVPCKKRKNRPSLKGRKSVTKANKGSNQAADNSRVDSPPITAVVSCTRNVTGSKVSIETFLPSIPFDSPKVAPDTVPSRFIASWSAGKTSVLLDKSSAIQSTLCLSRVMKHEPYQRNTGANHASYYMPETIDLHINVGCGKDLEFLGVASFAITGEEEHEVLLNVPAKKIKKTKDKKSHSSTVPHTKAKKNNGVFSSIVENLRSYELDDNATLKIGVQVVPVVEFDNHDYNDLKDQDKLEAEFDKLLTGIFATGDDHVELQVLPPQQDQLSEQKQVYIQNMPQKVLKPIPKPLIPPTDFKIDHIETPKTLVGTSSYFFCGAMSGMFGTCSGTKNQYGVDTNAGVPRNITTRRKIKLPTEALTLVSSVSDSQSTSSSPTNLI